MDKQSGKDKALAALKHWRCLSTWELIQKTGATRAPARVWELKEEGYQIDVAPIQGSNQYRYTLLSDTPVKAGEQLRML